MGYSEEQLTFTVNVEDDLEDDDIVNKLREAMEEAGNEFISNNCESFRGELI